MPEIHLMEIKDAAACAKIEAENFSRPWTEKGFADAVASEQAVYVTASVDGEICGYAGMWVAADEGEITNVSVKKEKQGCGIGHALLQALFAEGEKKNIAFYFLEVRESNASARRLYEKCGFVQIGIRKNFYEDPKEDGIVMNKEV